MLRLVTAAYISLSTPNSALIRMVYEDVSAVCRDGNARMLQKSEEEFHALTKLLNER